MLVLSRQEVEQLLDLPGAIRSVEAGFRLAGSGGAFEGFREQIPVDGGTFHVVGGGLRFADQPVVGLKMNGRFEPEAGTPDGQRVRGTILLADARDGKPLALMDSAAVTVLRTAAVVAVAARYLAREKSATALIVGSGRQGGAALEALQLVRPVRRVFVWSRSGERARSLADRYAQEPEIDVLATNDLAAAAAQADVIVTATPSTAPVLHADEVRPGTFVAAIGADGPGKQELDVAILAKARVVVDLLDQCARHGELAHAIRAGVMTATDVHASLAQVVSGLRPGRADDDAIFVFDSTGTAIQDVAAAVAVADAALARGIGRTVELV
jgi:ornithine cyclodeaminase/alanine dehydrogenase-like protein (mu-crystallin family)